MKKFLCLFIALCVPSLAAAEEGLNKLTLSGYLKTELSVRIQDWNSDLSKFKNIAELGGEYAISDNLTFFGRVKYWYDFAYALRDELDIAGHYMEHVQRTDWLRDCYLDFKNEGWFLRLGKQQVAWGQSDGIAVLDRVNPPDLSEYWLPDQQDIRIPLWMLNINYSPKLNSNLQLLIIPDFEQSVGAPIGAPFTFYSYIRYNNFKKSVTSVDENIYFPGKQLENSTLAAQWSDRVGSVDYTLNFLSGFYYSARNQTIFLGGAPPFNYKVDRSFKRWKMYGASFNTTMTEPGLLQGFTFKGDFAYYDDEPTYWGNPVTASSSGIKRLDNIFWILGADHYIFTKWLLSCQFGQYILQNSKPGASTAASNYYLNAYTYGAQDPVENIFSFKLSASFYNDRFKPEVLWSFTDDNQGRLSPKISYELSDHLVATLGVHYFYGSLYDSNGQFREESQLYSMLKYSF